eukprot:PRCOL_00001796-RA
MAGKGTGDGGGNATAVALTPNDEALQQAALAVVRQCMGGEGYKTDAEARAVCPALVAMLGEKSVGVRRNACAALAALAGCHGASKGCGGALMELKAPAAAAKCLADGAEARDGPLAANAAQAVAALANVVADGARALVEAGAPAAAAAIVAAAVAGGEWEATGDANEAAEMCAGAAMDAVCAIGAADGLAHHDALLDAGCAEAAVDMVVAMLGPAATMQALVALGMLMKHKRAQRAAFERNDGTLLPTLLAIRKAPGAGDAGALAAQLFSGLAQLEGGKERVAAALRADMKSTAAAEQDKAAKEDYTFV